MNGKRATVFVVAGTLALLGLLLTAAGAWAAPGHAPSAAPSLAEPISHTLSYQGYLTDASGRPVSGARTLDLSFYASATGGEPIYSQKSDVAVKDGLFTAQLDVDPTLFDGGALWLGIQVEGDPAELTPRQPLLPAPYAFYALSAPWSGLTGVPKDLADGDDDTLAGLTAADGQVPKWNATAGRWDSADDETGGTPDAWLLGGNNGTSYSSDVLGTLDPVSLTLVMSGTPALRLEYSGNPAPNLVAGYTGNGVTPGAYGAVIAGGGREGTPNSVTGDSGTVSGGHSNTAGADGVVGGGAGNTASGLYATVDGGSANAAAGQFSAIGGGANNTASSDGWYAAIGGGYHNDATSFYAAIGGGYYNSADGQYATIGGGRRNTADGYAATVPGGEENSALGRYSFAAGYGAQAAGDGSFVWSSGQVDTAAATDNLFLVRAPGGVYFLSNTDDLDTATGTLLSPGDGSWHSLSDRNVKENFQDVDLNRLLQTLAGMPIQSWNMKSQDPAIRHIGPVAQDFNGDFSYLFGQVDEPRYISNMDETGIALAAAQGLYQRSQEQAAQIAELQAENAALQSENESLQAQLADLAARVAAIESAQGGE